MPRQRFNQRPRLRRAPILSSLLVLAFWVFAPSAFGEPAEEQYNFNPPGADGNSGESAGGSTGIGASTGGPGAQGLSLSTAYGESSGGGNGESSGGGKNGKDGQNEGAGSLPSSTVSTFDSAPDEGSGAADESALSAFTDSIGLGMMPVLLAAMAAIAIGAISVALYRRRDRDAGSEAV